LKEKLHIELSIPKEWTGKQAKTFWVFLESIMEAIWEVHGDEINEVFREERTDFLAATRDELPEIFDDIPF